MWCDFLATTTTTMMITTTMITMILITIRDGDGCCDFIGDFHDIPDTRTAFPVNLES